MRPGVAIALAAGVALAGCNQPPAPAPKPAAPPAHIFTSGAPAQVIVASVRIAAVPGGEPGGVIWQVDPVFTNTGQSPAVGLSYAIVATPSQAAEAPSGPRAQPGDPEADYRSGRGQLQTAAMGTQAALTVRGVELPPPAQQLGHTPPAISGALHYRDGAGAAHVTKFCFFVARDADGPTSAACPHWNCVDAACAADAAEYQAEMAMAPGTPGRHPPP